MAGYIGSKAVLLSTTAAVVTGDMTVAGATTLSGAFTSLGIDDNATSTAITIDASENVGIGDSSPAEKLSVTGNITATGVITVSRDVGYGSVEVGGPSGAFIDLKSPASDDYDARIIYNGGTNLQITTLAADEPILLRQGGSTKLETSSAGVDVTGNLVATGNVTAVDGTFTGDVYIGDDLFLTGPTPTIFLVDNDIADEYTQLVNAGGNTILGSRNGATNGQLIFRGEGGGVNTEYARFDAAGNFGIGNSTPAALLHVGSTDNNLGGTAGDEVSLLTLQADTSNTDLLQFTSERLTTGTSWTTAAHRIQRKVDAVLMGYMQFGNNTSDLITFGKSATEYMRIDGSGNVGIGTSSPSAVLHSLSSGSSDTGVFERGDVSGTSRITIKSGDGSYGTINAPDGGNTLAFYTGATEAMRVDASGNVTIGETSNPGYRLSIKGAGTSQRINRTGSDGAVTLFQNDGVGVGNISVSASNTAYNTSSDYRLKENITPIQGAADTVMAMQPCTYTAIADGVWYDGFLAHELQEVHPRAVQGTKDAMMDEEYEITPAVEATYAEDGTALTEAVPAVTGTRSVPDMQSVDYSKLTPILTAALQEALTEIAALKVRVAALEVTP